MFKRVIIIDDEPATRFLIKIQVQQILNIEAICYESIELEAEILENNSSTLFILDQNLTEAKGDCFLRKNFEKLKHHTFLFFGKPEDFRTEETATFKYIEKSKLTEELKILKTE